jgi:hypothetical protein
MELFSHSDAREFPSATISAFEDRKAEAKCNEMLDRWLDEPSSKGPQAATIVSSFGDQVGEEGNDMESTLEKPLGGWGQKI